jgi:hypothetical protein
MQGSAAFWHTASRPFGVSPITAGRHEQFRLHLSTAAQQASRHRTPRSPPDEIGCLSGPGQLQLSIQPNAYQAISSGVQTPLSASFSFLSASQIV